MIFFGTIYSGIIKADLVNELFLEHLFLLDAENLISDEIELGVVFDDQQRNLRKSISPFIDIVP
jgi:hypothetical protein